MITEILLKRRNGEPRVALIDAEDVTRVQAHHWFFDGKYAAARIAGRKTRLHRYILDLKPGEREVDHINRNPLDNRRENLRLVTHAENCQNAPSQGGSSKYRGVTWEKARRKWKAQAKANYRVRTLGRFDDEQDAARAVEAFWDHYFLYDKLKTKLNEMDGNNDNDRTTDDEH